MPAPPDLPDWRDASAYAALLHVDRSLFAWEWLRRRRDYRCAAARGLDETGGPVQAEQPRAARWGLHRFEDAGRAAPLARPVWRSERYPSVLRARAESASDDGDALVLGRLAELTTIVRARDCDALLLSDGRRSLRLDVHGALIEGPVQLHYLLSGFTGVRKPLLTLQRLLALVSTGRFSIALHPPETRAWRHILLLRAHDALATDATQRAIAAELLSMGALEERWRIREPSLRSRVQRLVKSARRMAAGGFWELLA